MTSTISLSIAGWALLLSASIAEAGMIVSGNLTGTISGVNDPVGMFGDAKVGDLVSGFVLYSTDPAAWEFVGTSEDYRTYQTINPDRGNWDLMIEVTTSTSSIANKDPSQPLFLFSAQWQDNPSTGADLDSLAFLAYDKSIFQPNPVVTEVNLNFRDPDGQLFSGSSPPSSIIFHNADQRVGEFSFLVDVDGDGSRETRSSVFFRVDSLNIAPVVSVPEPSSLLLFGLGTGILVACSRLRKYLPNGTIY